MNDYELMRVVSLLDRLRQRFAEAFPEAEPDDWRVLSPLVRLHVQSRPITLSGLVTLSGLPYGTATRHIQRLLALGLFERRLRRAGGKRFLYYPTSDFLERFSRFAAGVKVELAMLMGEGQGVEEADFFLGGLHQKQALSERQLQEIRAIGEVSDLRFLLHEDWYFLSLRHAWTDLRSRLGRSSRFTLLPRPALHERVWSNAARPLSEFDIVALPAEWVPPLAEAGALLPLGAAPGAAEGAARWPSAASTRHAVPAHVALDLLAVRGDLCEEASVPPPASAAEMVEAARRLHDPRAGRSGIAWSGRCGGDLGRTFLSLLDARSPLAAAPGVEALLSSPEALAAFECLRALLPYSAPGVLEAGEAEAVAAFASGRAALCLVSSLAASRFELDLASIVKQRVLYRPVPGGGAKRRISCDAFLLAVPANLPEPRRALALRVLEWMEARQPERGLRTSPLFSLAHDPERARTSPIRRLALSLEREQRLGPRAPLPPPGDVAIARILGEHLNAALRAGAADGRVVLAGACKAILAASPKDRQPSLAS
ncbi:extracellular solute-binding protein [Aureimonas populi]|uniref:Extracellular solute-binding protein n=1 Tax=Aureimonas populi TaxID=1701758 RepID=A0ABW5CH34_9HYPH|nr:extracellular solute-binding protein [Aureimonas populi]